MDDLSRRTAAVRGRRSAVGRRQAPLHRVVLVAVLAGACAPTSPPAEPEPRAPELPPLGVEQVEETTGAVRGRRPRGLVEDGGERITVRAVDADLRRLLPALAAAADVDLVLSPEVRGRVSVFLEDVPAREALRLVIEGAGLSFDAGPVSPPWPPVVFYRLPVNIEEAGATTIRRRFGVSRRMAEWIVEARVP